MPRNERPQGAAIPRPTLKFQPELPGVFTRLPAQTLESRSAQSIAGPHAGNRPVFGTCTAAMSPECAIRTAGQDRYRDPSKGEVHGKVHNKVTPRMALGNAFPLMDTP